MYYDIRKRHAIYAIYAIEHTKISEDDEDTCKPLQYNPIVRQKRKWIFHGKLNTTQQNAIFPRDQSLQTFKPTGDFFVLALMPRENIKRIN